MRMGATVASAVLLCAAQAAWAGFTFNYTVGPNVVAPGTNIFRFYAKNDQQGSQTGTQTLMGVSARMQSLGGPFRFDFIDVDGDGLPDANVNGVGMSEADVRGTFIRIGNRLDWFVPWQSLVPANGFTNTGLGGNPSAFNSTLLWGLDGVNLTANQKPPLLDATTGLGCFFGAAIVPDDTDVQVSGLIAAENGAVVSGLTSDSTVASIVPYESYDSQPSEPAGSDPSAWYAFDFIAYAPEPGTLGIMVVGAMTFLARRRRLPTTLRQI